MRRTASVCADHFFISLFFLLAGTFSVFRRLTPIKGREEVPMKRGLTSLLAALMLLTFAACGASETAKAERNSYAETAAVGDEFYNIINGVLRQVVSIC